MTDPNSRLYRCLRGSAASAAAGLALALSSLAFAQTEDLTIDVRGWVGGPFASDESGAFSHCSIARDFDDGIRMVVSMNADFAANIALVNEEWSFEPRAEVPSQISVDGGTVRNLQATIPGESVIAIAVGPDVELIEALRRGLAGNHCVGGYRSGRRAADRHGG